MKKLMRKLMVVMLISVSIICTVGCQGKIPKGMSEEMYGYVKEISVTVHKFLDGEIERSDMLELEEFPEKMVDHVKKEYDDGSLVEKYYNDKEVGMLCTELMIDLFTEDNMREAEATLDKIDEFLSNK